jgi:DNA-binding transcriptional ArsR family regulator
VATAGRASRATTSGTDLVFAALADATRRTVLHEVAARGEATATELAADMPVSRQAVVKHLGVLADAGLVVARKEGRERRFRPTPAPLADAMAWMAAVGAQWDERLARLARVGEDRR